MEVGFQSSRDGLAPSSQLGAGVLESAKKLWQGRSAAGKKMAAEIQRCRPFYLGRTSLCQRSHDRFGVAAPNLSGDLGKRTLSVSVPLQHWDPRIVAPDARVVPGQYRPGGLL